MRITSVRSVPEKGIPKWDECSAQQTVIVRHMPSSKIMTRGLVGREPSNAKRCTTSIRTDIPVRRSSLNCYAVISGIAQVVWDSIGKDLNMPVCRLFWGTTCTERNRAYADGSYYGCASLDEMLQRAVDVLGIRVSAVDLQNFPWLWRTHIYIREDDRANHCGRPLGMPLIESLWHFAIRPTETITSKVASVNVNTEKEH